VISAFHVSGDGSPFVAIDPGDLDETLRRPGWVWLDAQGADAGEVAAMCRRLGFDELAIEDAVSDSHFPKVDDLGDHLLAVLHGIAEADGRLDTIEIDAFVTERVLFTIHGGTSTSVRWILDRGTSGGLRPLEGPDRGLSLVAEVQSRRHLRVIEVLDDEIDALEQRALEGDPDVLGEVQALRRDVTLLRRVVGPQRDVLAWMSRPLSPLLGDQARLEFDSVQDHYFRLVESLDAARTLLAAVLDTYRSTTSEQMNEVMKVLTVYSAILLPLTLLTGIYGMNFVHMPELGWDWGYYALLGLMAAVAVGQWTYFARRGFVGGFRPQRIPRAVGKGLVRLARAPVDAASAIARMPTSRSPRAERARGVDEEAER
jgi:magnesium transporter